MDMFRSFQAVMADDQITTAGKCVFINLLSRMDRKGYCYPAVATMEKETGYSERTIQRQTKSLAEKGYIVTVEQKSMGKQFSNRYYLAPIEQETELFFFSDVDLRNKIYETAVFQNFLMQQEVRVKIPYKNYCIQRIFRTMSFNKIEKFLLSYFTLKADQEGFMYFSIQRLRRMLKLSGDRICRALKSLKYRNFLEVMTSLIDGEVVVLLRLKLEKFGLSKFVKKKYKKKKEGRTLFVWTLLYAFEVWMAEKWKIQNLNCLWKNLNSLFIYEQKVGLHSLFRNVTLRKQ